MSNNNNNSSNINSKDFLIGTLIGGIVGASAALFLAPKSGKELRNDINEQATLVKERTNQLTSTAVERGSELAEAAKDVKENLSKTVTEQSSTLVNKVKSLRSTVEEMEENAQEVEEIVREAANEYTEEQDQTLFSEEENKEVVSKVEVQ